MAMKNKYYSRNCGNKRKKVLSEKNSVSFIRLVEKLTERWSEMIADDILDSCDLNVSEIKVKTIIEIIER